MIDLSYMIKDMETQKDNRTEERRNRFNGKHWQKMRDELSWFMKHNAKAYMVLLD